MSGIPVSFAASGALYSLALQSADREGHGSKARKAFSTPSSHSGGGRDVDVKEQKEWGRATTHLRIANRRKGPMPGIFSRKRCGTTKIGGSTASSHRPPNLWPIKIAVSIP